MIASLRGQVTAVGEDAIVVEVGGVGYSVHVPTSVRNEVMHIGQPIVLHTHLIVRENLLALYGFFTAEEEELFSTLLGVSGIGPRTAMAVLTTFSPETLRGAIAQGDASALTRIPGIGRKTAERLMLDLRDRIDVTSSVLPGAPIDQAEVDVINALTALGYSLAEARGAVDSIPEDTQSLDQRILAALRYLGT